RGRPPRAVFHRLGSVAASGVDRGPRRNPRRAPRRAPRRCARPENARNAWACSCRAIGPPARIDCDDCRPEWTRGAAELILSKPPVAQAFRPANAALKRCATFQTLLAIFGAVLMLSSACTPNRRSSAADLLHAQFDEDWKYWMTQYPELATSVGYPGQNARWTDYSQAAIDARAAYLKKSADRLTGVDRAALDANDQLNYDLYRGLLDTTIKGLDFHNDAVPILGVISH